MIDYNDYECCKDCTDRQLGCHGKCWLYAFAKLKAERRKVKQREEVANVWLYSEDGRNQRGNGKRKKIRKRV